MVTIAHMFKEYVQLLVEYATLVVRIETTRVARGQQTDIVMRIQNLCCANVLYRVVYAPLRAKTKSTRLCALSGKQKADVKTSTPHSLFEYVQKRAIYVNILAKTNR